MKNNLEKLFRESLDKHEMPYDPKAWEAVEKQLPNTPSPALKITLGTIAVAAITIITVLMFNSTPETNQTENNVVVENNVVEENNNTNNVVEENIISSDDSNLHNSDNNISNVVNDEIEDNKQIQNDPSITNQIIIDDKNDKILSPNDVQKPLRVESSDSKWLIAAQNAYISTSSSMVCKGSSVTFTLNNVPENSVIEWIVDNGKSSSTKSLTLKMNESSSVSVRLRNANDTKISHNLNAVNVQVVEPQNLMIEVTEDLKHTKPYFILENKNNQLNSVQWTMDYKRAQGNKMGVYLTEKGDYTYTVSAKDQNGCEIEKEGVIRLGESYNLFAGTGFSPNSSIAERTVYIPIALLSRDVEFKMSIYDRAGSLIYETTDKNKGWDGTMPSGGSAAVGSYMWVVTLINEEGLPEKYKGQLVLTQ